MSNHPIVMEETTAYALSCIPSDMPEHEQFRIRVRKRERWGGWAVFHLDMLLTTDGQWVLASSFMAGEHEAFAKRTGFATAKEALVAARRIAPLVKNWDGQTVADVLSSAANTKESPEAAS